MQDFLIVGSFPEKSSKIIGGQFTACKNFFPVSLYDKSNTIRFDTTQISNPPPNLFFRFFLSIKRFPCYFKYIFFKRPKKVIILFSSGTSFLEKTIYLVIAKSFNCKTIVMPRSDLIIEQIKSYSIYKFFFNILLKSTTLFIFQSESFLLAFPELRKRKYVFLPNCIRIKDKNNFIVSKKLKKSHEINLLFVGWLEPIKNITFLLIAIKKLEYLWPNKNINLHIVGDGTEKNFLKKRSQELNLNIIFHGWIKNRIKLDKIYSSSDCFCLTSKNEGFPNVVLEAMSNGLPIISTRVGALPFWLKEGRNILFSEENDSLSFAKNIKKLFSSKKLFNIISKNNIEDAGNKFNCEAITSKLKIILDE